MRLVAEHRLPERFDGGDVHRVDRDLELGDGGRFGGDPQLGGDRRDRAGHLDIVRGEAVGVVGGQQDVDTRVGDRQIGMVVRRVGRSADAGRELEALGHRARVERGLQRAQQHPPVVQPAVSLTCVEVRFSVLHPQRCQQKPVGGQCSGQKSPQGARPARRRPRTSNGHLPELPHWETTPVDRRAAIGSMKEALRTRIDSSGRSVDEVFSVIEARVRAQVDDISAPKADGRHAWPVVSYADIAAGTVSPEDLALLHRRGCVVVRGDFPRQQALDWDGGIVEYVERNQFFETYRGPGDDFFGSVGSKPAIYPIYWSPAQMEARQSNRMAHVQRFLNEQWTSESDGTIGSIPARDAIYPDRIRRRPPGRTSSGLGAHLDSGTLDLWMTSTYQRAFRHLFDGSSSSTTHGMLHIAPSVRSTPAARCARHSAPSRVGQRCQTWTTTRACCIRCRLSMRWATCCCVRCSQMSLTTTCAVSPYQVLPITERWHSLLLAASSGIPDVRVGDSVWWHSDMIHSVAPVVDQHGWGNVMYIPAAPWCPRNDAYAESVREAFLTGSSPNDFPEEHYERTWTDRFMVDDLNDVGRRGLGII